ncbi:hypothetical protein JG687_00014762 [Phytophthora cactorum]|uniref:Uncharacterized protein n=1 Tax=Phytophthora cactorum TaxID=29920 RepID=A0A8T1TYT9_9STRA|nr:hypothetical protein JG687_00014762 [Phytophthora cactorum]
MSNHSFQHRPPNPYAHEYQVQEDAPFEAHQILQVQCRQQKGREVEAKPLKRAREYMPATNPLRPESTARTGCIYSRSCKAELVVKEDGTTLSMCEEHKNYQAVKLRERRAKMPSRQFDPLQCQYPGGCKKERLFKLNGDRQLCRSHLATYVQKEIDNLWHNVVLYLPRMDRSSADIMVTRQEPTETQAMLVRLKRFLRCCTESHVTQQLMRR